VRKGVFSAPNPNLEKIEEVEEMLFLDVLIAPKFPAPCPAQMWPLGKEPGQG
jgi:hypothetical protein